jgi:hypothetical protein
MGGKVLLDVMVGIVGAFTILFVFASIMGLKNAWVLKSRARACKESPGQFVPCKVLRDMADQAVAEKWGYVRFSSAWLVPILIYVIWDILHRRKGVPQLTPLIETDKGG